MKTPSRTPDGDPFRCPVCGRESRPATNHLANDQICAYCGSLAWVDPPELNLSDRVQESETAIKSGSLGNRIFKVHDRVRITKGNFAGLCGEIDRAEYQGRYTVIVSIFDRETPLDIPEEDLKYA